MAPQQTNENRAPASQPACRQQDAGAPLTEETIISTLNENGAPVLFAENSYSLRRTTPSRQA